MALIEWDEKKLGVGVEFIDRQHKVIVSYINELSELIDSRPCEEDINHIFNNLVNYTQYHFKAEEKYFGQLNKNDLIIHKLQHKHFIEQLNSLKAQRKKVEITSELLEFLLDWLVIHIQCEDKKFIQK
ncbi:bacteriohemerythrin [Colwelliaceae bacterium 6441]